MPAARRSLAASTSSIGCMLLLFEVLLVPCRGTVWIKQPPFPSSTCRNQRSLGHVFQDEHEEDPHGDMTVSTAILNIVADLCPHGENEQGGGTLFIIDLIFCTYVRTSANARVE